jgi:outer membrane protein assembly factor BamB
MAVFALVVSAADWPRFRGPNGSGVAEATTNLPAQFGPGRNVVWRTALPPGHSSPIVDGNYIFATAVESDKLLTFALDRASGKVLWRRECPRPRKERIDKLNNPASPTPVSDGRNVYVFFGDYGLVSYGFDGNERWRLPLGPFNNIYGMGASPMIANGLIVLVCDQASGSFVVAVGKDDGKIRWKRARPEALSGHSTPILYVNSGRPQIIAPSSFRLDAFDARTGELTWFVRGLASEMKSVPVLSGDKIYINGFNTPENDPGKQVAVADYDDQLARDDRNKDGKLSQEELSDPRARKYFAFEDINHDGVLDREEWRLFALTMAAENGLLAIRAGGKGDTSAGAMIWKYHKSIPQLPSTLLYNGVLYMLSDSGVLTTLDPASGSMLKQARLRGVADRYFASPVAGAGKVFIVSMAGAVTVLEAGPEQKMLAVNELDDEVFATPAIADDRLYVRTRSTIYCFGAK